MTSRRSPPQPRPKRPRRLEPDVTGADPLAVLKALAHEARVAGQIEMMPRPALAQAIAAIDDFNAWVRLPPIYPHLSDGMQLEIDRHRALRERIFPRSNR